MVVTSARTRTVAPSLRVSATVSPSGGAGSGRSDPRVAVHSASAEPDEAAGKTDPDAKLYGRAVEITDPDVVAEFAADAPPGGMHLFRLDITELVVTGVEGDPPYLSIDYWRPDGGVQWVECD
jgi:hypothetical protein